jgi:hypothetical protein
MGCWLTDLAPGWHGGFLLQEQLFWPVQADLGASHCLVLLLWDLGWLNLIWFSLLSAPTNSGQVHNGPFRKGLWEKLGKQLWRRVKVHPANALANM